MKSPPEKATLRPSTRTVPTTMLEGVSAATEPSSHVAVPASAPISWKVPGSASRSIRSRTVSLPRPCWKATLSGPPICSAMRRCRSISLTSSFQLMGSPV